VKIPRPIEELGTLTRRSKDPRSLRRGVVVSMAQTPSGTSARQPIFSLRHVWREPIHRNSWHRLLERLQAASPTITLNQI
jgi:hypothetical protein